LLGRGNVIVRWISKEKGIRTSEAPRRALSLEAMHVTPPAQPREPEVLSNEGGPIGAFLDEVAVLGASAERFDPKRATTRIQVKYMLDFYATRLQDVEHGRTHQV
jgi:hypothetical protein